MSITPEEDYHAWALNAARRAREGLLTAEELEQVAEELEDMAKSERRELRSRLAILLAHLLKWKYQPRERSYSWEGTINGQRKNIQILLKENPSLRQLVPEYDKEAYEIGIQKAVEETNMSKQSFPGSFKETGWNWEQILSEEYFPN